MCSGNDCPKKTSCYRYVAPKSTYQSFLERTPDEDGECDAYWEVKLIKITGDEQDTKSDNT